MMINNIVKNFLKEHKNEIEIIQWSIMSGVASLFYSEYIRRFKYRDVPVKSVLVPSIKNLNKYFTPTSEFMEILSNELINLISNHPLIKKYSNIPELIMFNNDNIEMMKTIYDVYISTNISRRIPETISIKFGLNDINHQIFKESWEIDLFDNQAINIYQIDYIVDQIVLQLLILSSSIEKEVNIPDDNSNIIMSDDEILTIKNDNALCPIHFNENIINNKSVIDLLLFVTNTKINNKIYDNCIDKYLITSGITNKIELTKLY